MKGHICQECVDAGHAGRFASESALQMHRRAKHPLRAPLPPLKPAPQPPRNSLHYRHPAHPAPARRSRLGRALRNIALIAVLLGIAVTGFLQFAKVYGW